MKTTTVEISLGGSVLELPSDGIVDASQSVTIEIDGVGTLPASVVGEQSLGLRFKFESPPGPVVERLGVRIAEADRADQRIRERLGGLPDRIAKDFEAAVESGRISEDQLFDLHLEPIPNTNPQQHRSRSLALMEQILPGYLEEALTIDPQVVFCVAADRNGYLPCHNKKYSHPPGPDPIWNAGHCRNRRVFDDRTGLTAARNTKPSLCQTYQRELGGGKTVLMKDLSVPITVRGRHWGGLRLGMTLS